MAPLVAEAIAEAGISLADIDYLIPHQTSARAIRKGERDNLVHEFSDVLAWLASLANLLGIDLEEAAARYAKGCPKCSGRPCTCPI